MHKFLSVICFFISLSVVSQQNISFTNALSYSSKVYFTRTKITHTFLPSDLDSLDLWLEDSVRYDTNLYPKLVDTWFDMANGNNAVNLSGSYLPFIQYGGLCGHNYIYFSTGTGSSNYTYLDLLSRLDLNEFTIFMVYISTDNSSRPVNYIVSSNDGERLEGLRHAGSIVDDIGLIRTNPNEFLTADTVPDDWIINTYIPNKIYINNVEYSYTSQDSLLGLKLERIGTMPDDNAVSNFFIGGLATMIVYSRILPQEERDSVNAYLEREYGYEIKLNLLGDSRFRGQGSSREKLDNSTSFASLFNSKVCDSLGGTFYLNSSKGGITARGLLQDGHIYFGDTDFSVLGIGINDAGAHYDSGYTDTEKYDTFVYDLSNLLDEIYAVNNSDIYILELNGLDTIQQPTVKFKAIEKSLEPIYNHIIDSIATARSYVIKVPVYDSLNNTKYYIDDGLHENDLGHAKKADVVFDFIYPLEK